MKVLILAGGKGTRLWPLSRSRYPKQFLQIGGKDSFLQKTVKRALHFARPADIYVMTSQDYSFEVIKQVREIDTFLEQHVLIEPSQKNTAPAIAYALQIFMEREAFDEKEVIFVTPSDHLIAPEEEFAGIVKNGELLAKNSETIVTFGIRPTRPETGFGYLKAHDNKVERFVEKPTLEAAQAYLEDGHYFWNSGMFAFTLKTLLKEFQEHAPFLIHPSQQEFNKNYPTLPSISIDYAVMEKSKQISMLALTLSWSDIGCWDHVYETGTKDLDENVTYGNVLPLDTSRCLIFSSKRLISTIGVSDLLIIETDDAILIARREESQKVKEIVHSLEQQGSCQIHEHTTHHRPWGLFSVLEEGGRYKIKRIQVKPHQKLSLQLHYHRSEHWVVVKGTARVTIGNEEQIVHEGESIFVPKSAIHRVENPGKVPLEIIEVQVGEYLGEDDIVRLEDVYGRLQEKEAFDLLLSNRRSKN